MIIYYTVWKTETNSTQIQCPFHVSSKILLVEMSGEKEDLFGKNRAAFFSLLVVFSICRMVTSQNIYNQSHTRFDQVTWLDRLYARAASWFKIKLSKLNARVNVLKLIHAPYSHVFVWLRSYFNQEFGLIYLVAPPVLKCKKIRAKSRPWNVMSQKTVKSLNLQTHFHGLI